MFQEECTTKAFLVAKIRNFHLVIKNIAYRGKFMYPHHKFVHELTCFCMNLQFRLVWARICKCLRSPGTNSSARIYRPSLRENKPKALISMIENERFGLVFPKNWVYKFGHWAPSTFRNSDSVAENTSRNFCGWKRQNGPWIFLFIYLSW